MSPSALKAPQNQIFASQLSNLLYCFLFSILFLEVFGKVCVLLEVVVGGVGGGAAANWEASALGVT